jgi:3-oxoacyl-[acyl-carrier protein] reductase
MAGAGGTLGAAITERFLREGAHVVGCDRSLEALEALGRALTPDFRDRWSSVLCDVSDADAVDQAVAQVVQARGEIDVLVNNAGVSGVVPVVEMSEQQWDEVLDVNAKSVFLLSRAVLPGMLARRYGAIVSIASQAGKRGEPFTAHYCAAKAAVINFSRALAWEVAPHVRVNTVCPGYIESAMTRAGESTVAERTGESVEQLRENRRKAIPLGSFQSAEDIAAAVCFLASEDARNITGVAMDVNGGETMN